MNDLILVSNIDIFREVNNFSTNYNFIYINNLKNDMNDSIIGIITNKKEYNNIYTKINLFKNLKIVGIIGNSLGKLNLNYLFEKNIKVVNTGNIDGKTCAEYLLMLSILGIRKASLSNQIMKKGRWGIETFNNSNNKKVDKSFYSCKIGIYGYGFITKEFLKLLTPFQNEIKIYSNNIDENEKEFIKNTNMNINLSSEVEVLNSDIVIINRGYSKKTHNSFGKQQIDRLKSGTILINISRAGIVDNEYLFKRLLKNDIFACLDVFEKEPIDKNFKFSKLNNVFLTSHLAGCSKQIEKDSYVGIIKNVLHVLNTGYDISIISPKRYSNSHN